MKVFVVTKAMPLKAEEYLTVKSSAKEAEKFIRMDFSNAKKDDFDKKRVSFDCRGDYYLAGKTNQPVPGNDRFLMFIHEEEVT